MEKIKALLVFMVFWLSIFLTVSANAVSDCESIGIVGEDVSQIQSKTVMIAIFKHPIDKVKSCFGESYKRVIEKQEGLGVLFYFAGMTADFNGLPVEFVQDVLAESMHRSDEEQRRLQSQVLSYIVNRKDVNLLVALNQTGYFSMNRVFSDDQKSRPLICRSYFTGIHSSDNDDPELELQFWTNAVELGVSSETRCGDWTLGSRMAVLSEELGLNTNSDTTIVQDSQMLNKNLQASDQGLVYVGKVQFQFQVNRAGRCSTETQQRLFKRSVSNLSVFSSKMNFDHWDENCQMSYVFEQIATSQKK